MDRKISRGGKRTCVKGWQALNMCHHPLDSPPLSHLMHPLNRGNKLHSEAFGTEKEKEKEGGNKEGKLRGYVAFLAACRNCTPRNKRFLPLC